jgi:hypothetical protein
VRLLRRPGFRFVLEAAAILLAALLAGLRDVGWPGIIAAVAVVWVVAALAEYSLSSPNRARASRRSPQPPTPAPAPTPEPVGEMVRVLPREPEPVPYAVTIAVEAAPEADEAPPELVSDAAPAPEPEPEPEPEPVAVHEPQRWNIWELERAVRESGDVSEEQEFLLLYLRDYADPAGLLPLDFDELVRESFGDALVAVAG